MRLLVPRADRVVADILSEANAGRLPTTFYLTMPKPKGAGSVRTPSAPADERRRVVAAPAPKAPPRPQRPKPNRALERGQARAAAALLLELQGPDLERRKAECATWHRLRCNGWRPLPDATWRGPRGEVLDPNRPQYPRRTHR